MSNEYELARDNRQDLIFTKEQLLAPLLPGMEQPPHPMRLGDTEKDYYLGALTNPGTSAGAERSPSGRASAASTRRQSRRRAAASARRRQASDTSARSLAAAGEVVATGEAVDLLDPRPRSRCIGALGMVLARNAVHSALWLVLTMLCLGVFYVRAGRRRSSAWCRSSSTPARS